MRARQCAIEVKQEVDDLMRLSGFTVKLPKVHRPVFKSPDDEVPVLSIIDASGNPIFVVQAFIAEVLNAVGIFQWSVTSTNGEGFISVMKTALACIWWEPNVRIQIEAMCRDNDQLVAVESLLKFFSSEDCLGQRIALEAKILPLSPTTLAALEENPCFVHAKWKFEAAS